MTNSNHLRFTLLAAFTVLGLTLLKDYTLALFVALLYSVDSYIEHRRAVQRAHDWFARYSCLQGYILHAVEEPDAREARAKLVRVFGDLRLRGTVFTKSESEL